MTARSTLSLKRGLAFFAGVGFAAVPAVGPFLALLAMITGRLEAQRADRWWWLSALLLALPFLLNGYVAEAGLIFAQVIAVWLIYRSAAEFRQNVRRDTVSEYIGAGLIVGLGITLALGLRQLGSFRFDVAITALDAIVWNTHPALFGHALLVLSALLAVVVPSPSLRVVALAIGAVGVVFSGAREAVWAWLVVAIGLRFVGRRGTRTTRIADWSLVVLMVLIVSGVASLLGLGRTGFLTAFAPQPEEPNIFRGTEVSAGDWWYALGVEYRGVQTALEGQARTAYDVTKTWSEPWSRLQQAVTLVPGETYTLSAVYRAPDGTRPGFDGWGRESSREEPANLATTLDGDVHRATATGAIAVISSSAVTVGDAWVRAFVTFRYEGEEPLTWYVGVVPDRSNRTGVTTSFAEFQLTPSYTLLPYRAGPAERGVTDLRTSRFPIWRDALAAIAARPLLGWGPDGFPSAVTTLRPDETLVRPVAAHAHNALLSAWVNGGLVGAIGLLSLFAILSLRAVQQRDRAAVVVLAGVAMLNVFDSTLLSGAVLYPLAAVLGWRAAGNREAAVHETGTASSLASRLGLALADLTSALASFAVVALVIDQVRPGTLESVDPQMVFYLACAWPLANAAAGQYPGYGRPSWQELQWSVLASLAAGTSVALIAAVLEEAIGVPIGLIALAALLNTAMAPAARSLAKHALNLARLWGRAVVIVGEGGSADHIADSLTRQPLLGLKPVAVVDEAERSPRGRTEMPLLRPQLDASVERLAHHVIVVPGENRSRSVARAMQADRFGAFRIVQVVPALHSIPVTDVAARPLGRSLSLQVRNNLASGWNRALKRGFELFAVTLGSVLAAPLVALLALLIKLDSRGPVFFKQRRVGRDGKHFYVWKFRSMVIDAQERLETLLATDPAAAREWTETQKLVNDPRVTRMGRFLRRTSLDELPQLWNVIRGEMSLVGPRPIVDDEIVKYKDDYRYYTQVRPGMTGAWQVSGRSDTSYEFRVDLDTYYVRNWNLWIDLDILVKTVGVVLRREGAY